MNVEVVKGAKFLHRGALNLPAALFLQTNRFDPLPFPPPLPPPVGSVSIIDRKFEYFLCTNTDGPTTVKKLILVQDFHLALLHTLLPLLLHHVPLAPAPRAREHPHRVVVAAPRVLSP